MYGVDAFMKKLRSLFAPLYVAIIFIVCGIYIYQNIPVVSQCLGQLDFYELFLSCGLLFLCYSSQAVVFRFIQSEVEKPKKPLYYTDWFCGFIYGYIGRYIPGKVSMILARINFLSRFGISKKAITIAVLYENLIQIITSMVFGFPVLIAAMASESELTTHLFVTGGFLILLLVFLFSPLFEKLFVFTLKLLKKELPSETQFLRPRQMLRIIPFVFSTIALSGFSFAVVVNSFAPEKLDFNNLYIVAGAYVFSSAAGILALFAPSGIGVREGLTVFLLSKTLAIVEVAPLVVALIAIRILQMTVELFLLCIAQFFRWKGRCNRQRLPAQ